MHPSILTSEHIVLTDKMEKENDKENEVKVSFIVTGFGPFQGVTDNPTTTIANRLISYLKKEQWKPKEVTKSASADFATPRHKLSRAVDSALLASNTTVQILETSASNVRKEMDGVFEQLNASTVQYSQSDIESKIATTNHIVILHLGVSYKAKNFQIEKCAYNEASFRIPDEAGYQPKKESIFECTPFGESYNTNLDVNKICHDLRERRGYGGRVSTSGDPGRFVCNYTYYYSLRKSETFNRSNSNVAKERSNRMIYVLFLHVPKFFIESEENQMDFVVDLMDSIQETILKPKRMQEK